MQASLAAALILIQGWLLAEGLNLVSITSLTGIYASCPHHFLPGTEWRQGTCVQRRTMPENDTGLPDLWSTLTTPGWCLDKCVAKNFTYAGVQGSLCHCGNSSPTFARVHLSQCSWECEVDRNQTCGGPEHLSVVGPGYPAVPAYCAHEHTLEDRFDFEDPTNQRGGVPTGGWHDWCIEKCASSGNYLSQD